MDRRCESAPLLHSRAGRGRRHRLQFAIDGWDELRDDGHEAGSDRRTVVRGGTSQLRPLRADLRAKGPAVAAAPAWNWSGGYLGLHGGYAWGDTDFDTHPGTGAFAPAGSAFGQDIDGGVLGFHTGFNWQIGNIVFGLEGTTAWTGVEGKDTGLFAALPNADLQDRDREPLHLHAAPWLHQWPVAALRPRRRRLRRGREHAGQCNDCSARGPIASLNRLHRPRNTP